MKLTENFINNGTRIWLAILLLGIGGVLAFLNIGRLEDPAFTIKTAVVVTRYDGASAQQVEEEVTLPLENAIQQLPYIDNITSISSVGLSQITINIRAEYGAAELPQIWDVLRRRIGDAAIRLPPGASPPIVNDDFGDVYGFFFSLYGDGFSNQELRNFAELLRRELVVVPGVGKVGIVGVIPEEVQIEISRAQMTAANIIPQRLYDLLSRQNVVSNAGDLLVGSESIRLHPTGEFASVQELGNLLISEPGSPRSVYLRDIATISQGVTHSPNNIYRANGRPALSIGVSFAPNVNVIVVGEAVKARLAQLQAERPAGMDISVFYDQSHEVEGAVNGFIMNFLLALLIVVGTLLIFMGVRSGLVIAASLALNVLGTLLIMKLFNIELQRVSLGALVIALSMLVDNAIVIVEGVLVGRQQGEKTLQAINNVVKRTMFPLLGATVIAILAFAPIGLSNDATGEYCKSLFQVLLISLMLSWFTALTLTPVFTKWAFEKQKMAEPKPDEPVKSPYDGWLFRVYRNLLGKLLRQRTITLGVLAALMVVSVIGFGNVRQSFFPPSNTPIFFVDLWLPYGTDIAYTEKIAAQIEQHIQAQDGVSDTMVTIGQGAMRFMLTYNAQRQYSNYAQIMVRAKQLNQIPGMIGQIEGYVRNNFPQVNAQAKRIMFGPSNNSSIEARFIGPDPNVLRTLAAKAETIASADPNADGVMHDWQQRSKVIRPQFSDYLGRELGVDKREIDSALRMSFGGIAVGLYRDGTRLMPIVLRTPDSERLNAERLNDVMIWSQARQAFIPIDNVVNGFTTEWEDPLIMRRDRKRTLTVQADPSSQSGETSAELLQRIKPDIDAIPLPRGYELNWGGDYESTKEAQAGLFTSLPVAFVIMFIITVLMFSSLKNAVAIWLTIPLALIGVTVGFLLTGIPFGFMALIGLLSLSGMLIRNGIVLVEEIGLQRQEKPILEAIIDASTSRLRPILLTAFTTVLGLAPLLSDAFFQSMAVVIMFGLGFATVLTLLVLPVIYSCMNSDKQKVTPQTEG
ncbi:efflux RND transporter permease subunit [Serratia fonticola]|uniref:Efflux RND transporter permease subunit n=2 Tax=Serratia fonticola TaxID=47917 RepID=A0ABY9PKD3_SERFO|nr:efflux RND transporter permease subunit [Serratia fonticola]ATM77076.1 MFS transporter [Serratia fonticola]MBC3220261.1 efflux RND transporter permease subunit [Serratia fonticola]NBJ32890.1 AcrB/AcrD/AcrF family protein [Serratia fonticola]WMT13869.1 efflux RND transporter permease subunit [Serratia fonticola]HEJ9060252.1 efflux RND transporter permease subunit [Serratia fonticola]